MDRERAGVDEELRKERNARKLLEERTRDLEQSSRSSSATLSFPQSSSVTSGTSGDQRKIDLLEKQVSQLKQDRQREEMRRLEAETTLKTVERRANDLHNQV